MNERAMGCSVSSECKRALFFSPPLVHRTDESEEEDDTHANHTAEGGEEEPNGRTDGGWGRRAACVRARASKK